MAWGEEYEAEMKEPRLGMAKNPANGQRCSLLGH